MIWFFFLIQPHERQAQSEDKRKVMQDLFSSWPQLWCCWAQRVSPQHCSVAPVWDIARGSPPAPSVCSVSTTSPRTTDKLLRPHQEPPSSQLPRPSPGQRERCLGPVYQPDPVATSRHPGEQNGLPQDWEPLPHDMHAVWVWSGGRRWCFVRRELHEGLVWRELWEEECEEHKEHGDRLKAWHFLL